MALMSMKNIQIKLIILIICILCPTSRCRAHGADGHNNDLKKVLFGEEYFSPSNKAEMNFDLLCNASYLTLDFKDEDKGTRCYQILENSGVKELPTLESIAFSGNQRHQKYTHLGWEYNYGSSDIANWESRKKILLQTVDKICKFKKEEQIKKDAFAALIYEIHILGDHIGDSDYTRYDRVRLVSEPGYRGQDVSPTSNGPFNNPTLYTYLLYHIQRLFREQTHTYEYVELVKFLERHKNEFSKYENPKVPIEDIKYLANETLKVLVKYIPKLLEGEAFFQRAFL